MIFSQAGQTKPTGGRLLRQFVCPSVRLFVQASICPLTGARPSRALADTSSCAASTWPTNRRSRIAAIISELANESRPNLLWARAASNATPSNLQASSTCDLGRVADTSAGLSRANYQARVERELDTLVGAHLDAQDTINLSYYLNEYETSACDLSELLSNLMEHLLVKLPDPMIKYRFLNCIKRLYVDQSDCDEGFDEPIRFAANANNMSPTSADKRQLDHRLFEATARRFLVASSLLRYRSLAGLAEGEQRRRSRRQRRASQQLCASWRTGGDCSSAAPSPSAELPDWRKLRAPHLAHPERDQNRHELRQRATEPANHHSSRLSLRPDNESSTRFPLNGANLHQRLTAAALDGFGNTGSLATASPSARADVADIAFGPSSKHQQLQLQQHQNLQRQYQQRKVAQLNGPLRPLYPSEPLLSMPCGPPHRSCVQQVSPDMHDSTHLADQQPSSCQDLMSDLLVARQVYQAPVTFVETAHALDRLSLDSPPPIVEDRHHPNLWPAPSTHSAQWTAHFRPATSQLGQGLRLGCQYGDRQGGWTTLDEPTWSSEDNNEELANDLSLAQSSCDLYLGRKMVARSEVPNGFSSGFQQHSNPASTVSLLSMGSSPPLVHPSAPSHHASSYAGPTKPIAAASGAYLAATWAQQPACLALNGFRTQAPEVQPRCCSSMSVPCDVPVPYHGSNVTQELSFEGPPLDNPNLRILHQQQLIWAGHDRPPELAVSSCGFGATSASLPASPSAHDKLAGRSRPVGAAQPQGSFARQSADADRGAGPRHRSRLSKPPNRADKPPFPASQQPIKASSRRFVGLEGHHNGSQGERATANDGEFVDEPEIEVEEEEREEEEEEQALAIVAAPIDGRLSMSVAEQVGRFELISFRPPILAGLWLSSLRRLDRPSSN